MIRHTPARKISIEGARRILRMFAETDQGGGELDAALVTRQEVNCRLAAIQVFHRAQRPVTSGFERGRLIQEGLDFVAVANDLDRLVSLF